MSERLRKMKKTFGFVLAIAALAVLPRAARPGPYAAEPCIQSRLCIDLLDHFSMEEASNSSRYGRYGSTLHERSGVNTGNVAGKIGC